MMMMTIMIAAAEAKMYVSVLDVPGAAVGGGVDAGAFSTKKEFTAVDP